MLKRGFLVCLIVLLGCLSTAEKRHRARVKAYEGERAAAGKRAWANFRRLPVCPWGPTEIDASQHTSSGVMIPASFRRDRSVEFEHGGGRYTSGDTTIDVSYGLYNWSSFTDRSDGSGEIPNGCRAAIGGQLYLVGEMHDSGGAFRAWGTPITDTIGVTGCQIISGSAPRSMRSLLLQLLSIRVAPANVRCS